MKEFSIEPGLERRLIQESEKSEGLVLPLMNEEQREAFLQRLEEIRIDLLKQTKN